MAFFVFACRCRLSLSLIAVAYRCRSSPSLIAVAHRSRLLPSLIAFAYRFRLSPLLLSVSVPFSLIASVFAFAFLLWASAYRCRFLLSLIVFAYSFWLLLSLIAFIVAHAELNVACSNWSQVRTDLIIHVIALVCTCAVGFGVVGVWGCGSSCSGSRFVAVDALLPVRSLLTQIYSQKIEIKSTGKSAVPVGRSVGCSVAIGRYIPGCTYIWDNHQNPLFHKMSYTFHSVPFLPTSTFSFPLLPFSMDAIDAIDGCGDAISRGW